MSLNKAFREIGRVYTERSAFDLSHYNLTTFNMGLLYPVMCNFTMPSDKWDINVSNVIRAMPMPFPAYVDVDVNYHFYFVPMRLLWDDFEEFITGGEKGDFSGTMPKSLFDRFNMHPTATSTGFTDTLPHRLGLLVRDGYGNIGNDANLLPQELKSSILPMRAYYFIWNEYYRDQNLMSKVKFKDIVQSNQLIWEDTTRSAPHSNYILYVSWLKDYFTSALPFQQRGTAPIIPFDGSLEFNSDVNPNQTVSLGISNSLQGASLGTNRYLGTDRNAWAAGNVMDFRDYFNNYTDAGFKNFAVASKGKQIELTTTAQSLTGNLLSDVHTNVWQGLSISDLRAAVQVQKFLERNARSGVRYTEFLDAHYNVSPSDARLDRPEFIGGAKFPVVISDVFQTSDTENQQSPLGSYAGRGLSAGYDDCVNYFVEEFGYIIGLAFMRPKTLYSQGINRQLQYNDRFEFPFPEFMHLSEQGITNSEIYIPTLPYNANGDSVVTSASKTQKNIDPTAIFGYQGIYDELRWQPSRLTGWMANLQNISWKSWHLGRIFTDNTTPKLNAEFVTCKPRSDIFNITDINLSPEFIAQIKFDIKAVRPMPIIGEPGLIDHF